MGQRHLARGDDGCREGGRKEECQQKEKEARFDQHALSSDRKTVQFNVSKALIQINYTSTHLLTVLAVRLRHRSMLGNLKKAEGRLIAVNSFIVIQRDISFTCAIFLLDLDRDWYRQAISTRM